MGSGNMDRYSDQKRIVHIKIHINTMNTLDLTPINETTPIRTANERLSLYVIYCSKLL